MSEVTTSQGAKKFFFISLIVGHCLLAPAAFAAGKVLSVNYALERTESALELANGAVNNNVTRHIYQLRFSEDDRWGIFSYDLGFSLENPDYSSVEVLDAIGQSQLLSNIREEHDEYTVDANMALGKGAHNLTFGGSTSVGDVAFRNHAFNIGYQFSFFNKTSVIGTSYSWSKDWRIPTHFAGPLGFVLRPGKVETKIHSFTYDQILSEKLKSSFQYSYQKANIERPSSHKFVGRLGYVFTDQIFGRLAYTYADDNDDDPLLTDRGYFKAHGIKAEVTSEPIFDLFLSVSYDLVWEDENIKDIQRITRVGFDQYSVSGKYLTGFGMAATLKASYVETNLGLDAFNISGGLEWEI